MIEQTVRKAGWTRVAFGDVVRLSKERSSDPEADGFERYVGLDHLDPGELKVRRWGNIANGTTFTSVFRPGQVLFGKRRAYQRKVGVADFSGVCSGDIYVFEPRDPATLLPDLLPFLCQTDQFFDHAIGTSAGSLSPRTNWKSLAQYEFALPPLEEQRRIAELLRAIHRVEEGLHGVRQKGTLSLQATVDAAARKAESTGSLAPLKELVEADRPICYGILKPGTGFPGGVPVIKVKDYPDGTIHQEGLLRTDPQIDQEYKRSRLRPGDLLISIRGTVGRLAFVPPTLSAANITQDTARLSLRSDLNHRFVRTMLESSFVQIQIAAFITGLAVQGINIGELRRVLIPIIPRTDQDELVREVSAIRRVMGNTEGRRAHALNLRAQALEDLLGNSS